MNPIEERLNIMPTKPGIWKGVLSRLKNPSGPRNDIIKGAPLALLLLGSFTAGYVFKIPIGQFIFGVTIFTTSVYFYRTFRKSRSEIGLIKEGLMENFAQMNSLLNLRKIENV